MYTGSRGSVGSSRWCRSGCCLCCCWPGEARFALLEPGIVRGKTLVGTCRSGEKGSMLCRLGGSSSPSGGGKDRETGPSTSRSLLFCAGRGGSGSSPTDASSRTVSLWTQRSSSRYTFLSLKKGDSLPQATGRMPPAVAQNKLYQHVIEGDGAETELTGPRKP